MAWTTPKTWNVGDVLTAADMDTYVRDNSNFLAAPPAGKFTGTGTSGSKVPMTATVLAQGGVTLSNPDVATTVAGLYLCNGRYAVATSGAGYAYANIEHNSVAGPPGPELYTPAAATLYCEVNDFVTMVTSDIVSLGFATSVGGTISNGYLNIVKVSN